MVHAIAGDAPQLMWASRERHMYTFQPCVNVEQGLRLRLSFFLGHVNIQNVRIVSTHARDRLDVPAAENIVESQAA